MEIEEYLSLEPLFSQPRLWTLRACVPGALQGDPGAAGDLPESTCALHRPQSDEGVEGG